MKKDFDCNKCALTDICYEKMFVEECLSKMETREDNIYNPGPFGYSMQCYHYFTKEEQNFRGKRAEFGVDDWMVEDVGND